LFVAMSLRDRGCALADSKGSPWRGMPDGSGLRHVMVFFQGAAGGMHDA
jgi:hypothetical protein